MDWSLYDTDIGYYTHRARIGLGGCDFMTSPEISPVFSLLLAEQIAMFDQVLGQPEKFYLIEAGPGNGTMMRNILASLYILDSRIKRRLHPVLLENSPHLKRQQEKKLSGLDLEHAPKWWEPANLPSKQVEGVIIGNEFLDALPSHWIRSTEGGLHEVYVEIHDNGQVAGKSSPLENQKILSYLEWLGVHLPDGCETEISLDVPSVIGQMDAVLKKGFMLWIDYGDSAVEKYSQRRPNGTLRGFKGHQLVEDVLAHPPGSIDLTSHVDFSGVLKRSQELGHRLEGYSDQMSYLIGLGLEKVLEENRLNEEEIMAASTLVHPLKMGRIFKVLLTSKGIDCKTAWKGFPRDSLLPLL